MAHPFGRVKARTEVASHITSLVKNRSINSPVPGCLLLTSFLSYLGRCLGSRVTHKGLVGEDRGRWRLLWVNIMESWGGSISLEEGTGDNVICHEMTLWGSVRVDLATSSSAEGMGFHLKLMKPSVLVQRLSISRILETVTQFDFIFYIFKESCQ